MTLYFEGWNQSEKFALVVSTTMYSMQFSTTVSFSLGSGLRFMEVIYGEDFDVATYWGYSEDVLLKALRTASLVLVIAIHVLFHIFSIHPLLYYDLQGLESHSNFHAMIYMVAGTILVQINLATYLKMKEIDRRADRHLAN